MPSRLSKAALVSAVVTAAVSRAFSQQVVVTQIAAMPYIPVNYQYMNYGAAATGFDSTVFNPVAQTGYQYKSFWFQTDSENGISQGFGMPSYIGQTQASEGNGEAITQIGAVLGASLMGINKQSQTLSNGSTYDFVQMASRFYDSATGANLVLNNIGSQGTGSFWYDQTPQIMFDGLVSQYYSSYANGSAGQQRLNTIVTTGAAKMHSMIDVLAGNSTTATPSFNYQGFNYVTMAPISGNHTEPDGAGGAAYEQYMAYEFSGNTTDLSDAERCMNALQNTPVSQNPLYETILPFGALAAARLNAEQGTNYDVGKIVNWCFSPTSVVRTGWGAISAASWNGYGAAGLIGSTTDQGGYGFSMDGYEYSAALVPLVRYDDRFANAVGQWMLNLTNSSRMYFKGDLPAGNQTNSTWNDAPSNYYSYEGVKESSGGVSPLAGGDGTGYNSTWLNFAYGSGDVGVLGSIVNATNVPMILQLNLLATDFFHAAADPSYLMYNPYNTQKTVQINVGATAVNIYDAVTGKFLATDVSGLTAITIPAETSRSLVYTPFNGPLVDNGTNVSVNGVIVNYRSPELNRLYWDLNNATAGAGGPTLNGTWDATTANFNTSLAGTNATNAWVGGKVAMFAAGSDGGGAYTVNVSGTQSIGGLNFQTGNVTLTGGALSLASDSYITAASGTQTINTPISGGFAVLLDGNGTVVMGGANTYTGITSVLAGVLQPGNATALEHSNIDVDVNGGLNLNSLNATLGNLSGSGNVNIGSQTLSVGYNSQAAEYAGSLSGAGQVNKVGYGIWTLDGPNAYSGGTIIQGGELSVNNDAALGAAAAGLTFDGGTLQVTGNTYNSTPRSLSITGNGGGFDIASQANTFTVSQNLSGGPLSKIGAGTLVLGGNNTISGLTLYAGTVSVSASANAGSGTVAFGGAAVLNLGGSQPLTLANAISVYSTGTLNVGDLAGAILSGPITMGATLTKSGEGTLTLAGNASGSQEIDLRNGAIVADNNSPWAPSDNPPGVAVGDASSPNNENLSVLFDPGVTVASGRIFFEPYALQGTKTLGGTFNSGSATFDSFVHLLSSSINLQITDALGGQFNLPLGILGSTTAGITITGGGTVNLGGLGAAQSEYFQGTTTVDNGTLLLTGNDIVGNARDSYVLGNSSYSQAVQIGDANTPPAAQLSLVTGAAVTINHNISVNNFGGSVYLGGTSGNASTFNSAISLGKSANLTSASKGVVFFTGSISGIGGITASGTGTVSLSGANNYSGGTSIGIGSTLNIAAQGALPSGSTIVNNGVLTINGNSVAGNVSGAGALSIGAVSTALLQLAPGSGGSSQGSVIIGSGSTLDLANNHLIINYGNNPDPIGTIAGYLSSGFAAGAWNGPGIDSSSVAANPTYGVGYADGADGIVAGLITGQIEVKYTLPGDINLDGVVNGTDFAILAGNFGKSVTGWDQGDLDFNNIVNGSDFAELASNFGKSAVGADIALPPSQWASLDSFAAAHGLLADVPEPTSFSLCLLGTLVFMRRRH